VAAALAIVATAFVAYAIVSHSLERTRLRPTGRFTQPIDHLLAAHTSMVAIFGQREVTRIRELTREANQLERDITQRANELVPSLLKIPGWGALTAAKLLGEAANINRFKSRDA
jgi:transposase